jgi:hypothetical protein
LRCPTIPKVLCESVERIGRSGVRFGGVDPWVLFIPSCPGLTGLTGATDRSDRCKPLVGFSLGDLHDPCVFWLCCCWSVLGRFGVILLDFVEGSSSFQVVFWRCFVPGPRGVTEASWNVCCATAVATDLTGSVHWSDKCHRSDRRRPSV